MHGARCLIVLSAFLFVPAQATAQDEWEQQVLEQVRTVGDIFSSDGFALDAETPRGSLKSQASESFALTLESGFEYLLVGACDVDCKDIDLIIFDEAGNDVDSDYEEDDAPVLTVTPSRTQSYRVHVYMANCTNEPCWYAIGVLARRATATTDVSSSSDGSRIESGSLASGDPTLDSGEYYDTYSLAGTAGDYVVIDLRSSDFDPYLMLISPSRERFKNDDYEGDAHRSQVAMRLPESGDYIVAVTSYKADETGAYEVRIDRSAASSTASGARVEHGDLAAGDKTLESGEYADVYKFEGLPSQRVRLDVSSSDFDTYLMLIDPNGERAENDDAEGLPGHSVIEADITEVGTHLVVVTSYKPDETGSYELSMNFGVASSTASRQRDVVELAIGHSASGRLEPGDRQMDTGEYGDVYVFDGGIGESVNIEMTSSDFDTYLVLITPSGDRIENDDYDSQSNRSRIDLALRETGRYRIVTTSYKGNETGDYQLDLNPGASISTTMTAAAAGSGGRVYGVFAGISDYPGEADDLAYTAEDAHRVHDALTRAGMRAEDAIILTDEAATIGGVQSAFNTLSDRMGPNDTFIFFYSGHGNRIPRSDFQPADPDAMDETIELYDGSVTDDQMSEMLTGLNAGTSIIVLDACFSGGFAKDVISVPGRMGLFSSEEDVTSSVAAKFRAGGYLAVFLADAIGDGLADSDDDGGVSALELSQYLHERYRADVKSTGSSEIVRTGGPQLGYQHLVVDRGSISPYDVLFYFERGGQ